VVAGPVVLVSARDLLGPCSIPASVSERPRPSSGAALVENVGADALLKTALQPARCRPPGRQKVGAEKAEQTAPDLERSHPPGITEAEQGVAVVRIRTGENDGPFHHHQALRIASAGTGRRSPRRRQPDEAAADHQHRHLKGTQLRSGQSDCRNRLMLTTAAGLADAGCAGTWPRHCSSLRDDQGNDLEPVAAAPGPAAPCPSAISAVQANRGMPISTTDRPARHVPLASAPHPLNTPSRSDGQRPGAPQAIE